MQDESPQPENSPLINTQPYTNKTWSTVIPRVNRVFLIIMLVFVFGIDLLILQASPELFPFYIAMVIALLVFLMFHYIENTRFQKLLINSNHSSLDPWILGLIIARNIILALNVIPFIQLLGFFLVFTAGIPILIAYVLLVANRLRRVN